MGTGAFLRTLLPIGRPAAGRRRCSQAGFSFAEMVVTLAIAGSMAAGVSTLNLEGSSLQAARTELRATLDQAFHLARHRGTSVKVMVRGEGPAATAQDVLPLLLPRRIKWGTLPGVPLPKGMDNPIVADRKGEAHAAITITPRHTATATTWFLNDGREVLCMRLSGQGQMTLLRWKRSAKAWVRA